MKLPVTVTAIIHAQEGKAEVLEQLLLEQAEAVLRNEPGCLAYRLHRSVESPSTFMIYEQYVDEAARSLHQNSEHLKQYRTRRVGEGLVRGSPIVEVFQLLPSGAESVAE